MNVSPRNVMLVAFGIAGAVCVSGLSGEAADTASFATGAGRLTVVPNSAADHVMVPSGRPGLSALCRLPIQIANRNMVVRSSRCN
jgi:hypothetical protein